MPDIILAKLQTIERCFARIEEEYAGDRTTFLQNFTKQDSVTLNLERASQAAIDIAAHIVKTEKLGIPAASRELFQMLEEAGIITTETAKQMQKMVGFRNIAVHDYQNLNIDILVAIIENHLNDFLRFNREILTYLS